MPTETMKKLSEAELRAERAERAARQRAAEAAENARRRAAELVESARRSSAEIKAETERMIAELTKRRLAEAETELSEAVSMLRSRAANHEADAADVVIREITKATRT